MRQQHDPMMCAQFGGCACACRYCVYIASNGHRHRPLSTNRTPTMSNSNLRTAERRIAAAERELRAAHLALEAARDSTPPEPDGLYITFAIAYFQHGPRYRFAAINVGGYWYLTGQETGRFRWDALVKWMREKAWASTVRSLVEYGEPLEVKA